MPHDLTMLRPPAFEALGFVASSAYGAASSTKKQPSPEALWRTEPEKRKINVLGFFTGTMAGGEDEVIAVAGGARTSFKNRPSEDRATIRGGIEVLRAAGIGNYPDPKNLSSKIVQGPKADKALVKAAGGGSDLRSAASHIRRVVAKHKLERAAWGARGIYMLANLKGFAIARSGATTVLSVIPLGWTQAVAAGVAAHGSISAKFAESMAKKFQGYVKDGLASYAKKHAPKAKQSEAPELPTGPMLQTSLPAAETMSAVPSAMPRWGWIAAGIGAIALIALMASRRGKGA